MCIVKDYNSIKYLPIVYFDELYYVFKAAATVI